MSTGPARRACLLSGALLGIRGVWCKSTAFRHLANIPEREAAQATAGPEVGRLAGTSRWKRPAGDVRPCSRSPTNLRPSRCSGLRLDRPDGSRLAAPKRHARRRVQIRPRAPLSRSRSHSRPAPDFYSGEVRVQLPPAPPRLRRIPNGQRPIAKSSAGHRRLAIVHWRFARSAVPDGETGSRPAYARKWRARTTSCRGPVGAPTPGRTACGRVAKSTRGRAIACLAKPV